jgi:signal transduction histidine kinase
MLRPVAWRGDRAPGGATEEDKRPGEYGQTALEVRADRKTLRPETVIGRGIHLGKENNPARTMERSRVSHELRTPLAVIKGALQMAERHPHNREKWIEMAMRQAEVLERAIAEIESQLPNGTNLDDASHFIALEVVTLEEV